MNTIQQILSNLQNDVSALASYVSNLGSGTSTAVQTALANLNAGMSQLQTDANASPISQPQILSDVSSVLSLIAVLSSAIGSPTATPSNIVGLNAQGLTYPQGQTVNAQGQTVNAQGLTYPQGQTVNAQGQTVNAQYPAATAGNAIAAANAANVAAGNPQYPAAPVTPIVPTAARTHTINPLTGRIA